MTTGIQFDPASSYMDGQNHPKPKIPELDSFTFSRATPEASSFTTPREASSGGHSKVGVWCKPNAYLGDLGFGVSSLRVKSQCFTSTKRHVSKRASHYWRTPRLRSEASAANSKIKSYLAAEVRKFILKFQIRISRPAALGGAAPPNISCVFVCFSKVGVSRARNDRF